MQGGEDGLKSRTGAVLIRVRASKTDPAGDRTDIRMAKNGTADALDAIRPGAGDAGPVFGLTPGQINRRIQAAAAAGIDGISAFLGFGSSQTKGGSMIKAAAIPARVWPERDYPRIGDSITPVFSMRPEGLEP